MSRGLEDHAPFTHYDDDHTIVIDAEGSGVVTRHYDSVVLGSVNVQVEGF